MLGRVETCLPRQSEPSSFKRAPRNGRVSTDDSPRMGNHAISATPRLESFPPRSRRSTARQVGGGVVALLMAASTLLLCFATAAPASAGGGNGGYLAAKFNSATQQRDSVKSTLVVTVKQTPNTPSLGGRDHFGVEFYSKVFKFVGHVDGGADSCTTRATPFYPERGTDTYVDCLVTPGGATKKDSFFFAVKPDAPLGTTRVYVHANYGNVDNAIVATTQIGSGRPQCDSADFNFKGFCIPNDASALIHYLRGLPALKDKSPAARAEYIAKFSSYAIQYELVRLTKSKGLSFVSQLVSTILANQGHAS